MDAVSDRDSGWDGAQLQHVEPGYRHVLRLRLLIFWLPLVIGALILDNAALDETPFYGLASIAVPLIAILVVGIAPQRIYQRLLYGLTERLLQVVRGWLFHTDTIVPFVRVQHIDVTRGPLDKAFGTAALVVHTAGTHHASIHLDGLDQPTAEAVRDFLIAGAEDAV